MSRGPYTIGPASTGVGETTYLDRLGPSLLWEFRADQSTMKIASDGSGSQVADGDPVGYLLPTGNGTSSAAATQATSTKKPVFRSDYNSRGCGLQFDGVDDFMSFSDATHLSLAQFYMLAVVEINSGNGSTATLICRNPSGGTDRVVMASGKWQYSTVGLSPATSLTLDDAGDLETLTSLLVVAASDRKLIQVEADCRGWSRSLAPATGTGDIFIAAYNNGSQPGKLVLRHLIIGDISQVTYADLGVARSQLGTIWGL